MEREKWKFLWDNFFSPYAKKIKESNIHLSLKQNFDISIYEIYEEYLQQYKSEIFSKNSQRIDRHKISSILTCAILDVEPFENTSPKTIYLPSVELANEGYAVRCSTSLMISFLCKEYRNNKKPGSFIKKFLSSYWRFPCTTLSDDIYFKELITTLNHCRLKNNNKNYYSLIPLLNHIFFLLERYHVDAFEREYLSYKN